MTDKLKPIDFQKDDSMEDIFNKCHEIFKQSVATKDKPKLGEREIVVPLSWIENKAEIFWHASSIEQKSHLDILPCNNDMASSYCADNCINGSDFVIMSNGSIRNKCIYRAARVSWIRNIIDMYNVGDERVQYWEKVNSDKRNRIYLRYIEDEIDYMIVFEEKSRMRVRLITSYPVFFISAKRDYDRDYQNYVKSQKNKNR